MSYKERARLNASEIEKLIEILQEYKSQNKYRDFWNHTKVIVETFKTLKPLLKEDRERLWAEYSNICEDAKREMELRREEARSNASKIEEEIEKLRYNHCDSNAPLFTTRYYYKEFWSHAKEVTEMFKSLRLLKEDRERLWAIYRSICEDVKRKQEEERQESSRNREIIESIITDAYYQAGGSRNKAELDKARSMQSEALKLMKERRLLRKDREYCWKYWKEVNEKIYWRRHELQESNFLRVKEEAGRCLNTAYYGNPYEALQEIKGVQRSLCELYLNRDQRHEIHEMLSDAWNKAASKIDKIRMERRRRYEEWRERMESHIQRWENNIEKTEDYISRLEEQIDRLEDEAANARTDEYAERVRGWIAEKQQKIEDARERIREWECRIEDVRSKLNR